MRGKLVVISLALAATAVGCYGGQAGDPRFGAAASPSPAVSVDPSPADAPTPTPESTAPPTASPTEAPTIEPTADPTPAPTPKPTKAPLPWRGSGSIDVPLEIHAGTKIRFRLWDFSAPATCSLKFTWPDATVLKLQTKTATIVGAPPGTSNPYGIDWHLDIPSTQIGEGTFAYVCKYLGKVRLDSWYTISIQAPL